MALFGSGPRSNILQTVAPMYQGMIDAEKQKGAAMREAMGAFGKAIDPKTIGMRKFRQEFANADWTKPETFFRASKSLSFDPPAAMDMAARGQQLQASMAAKPKQTRTRWSEAKKANILEEFNSSGGWVEVGLAEKSAEEQKLSGGTTPDWKTATLNIKNVPTIVEYQEGNFNAEDPSTFNIVGEKGYESTTGAPVFKEIQDPITKDKYWGVWNKEKRDWDRTGLSNIYEPPKKGAPTTREFWDAPSGTNQILQYNPSTDGWDFAGFAPRKLDSGLSAEEKKSAEQTRIFNQSAKLRSELSKDFNYSIYTDAQLQFDKIRVSAQADTAAGDMSTIFAYMKMLDPDSVVREGEQATAENARGVADSIMHIYNKTLTGEKLTTAQRKDFSNRARDLLRVSKNRATSTIDRIETIAQRNNIPRIDVFGNVSTTSRVINTFDGIDMESAQAEKIWDTLSVEEREAAVKLRKEGRL